MGNFHAMEVLYHGKKEIHSEKELIVLTEAAQSKKY